MADHIGNINLIGFADITIDGELIDLLNKASSISGVKTGGEVTINADPTKLDVAAGTGQTVDWSTPSAPKFQFISWAAFTAQAIPNLALQFTTVQITPATTDLHTTGNLLLASGVVTTEQARRTKIILQSVIHTSGTQIDLVSGSSKPAYQVIESILDYINILGTINTGNEYVANGANLTFDKLAGTTSLPFINRDNDTESPTTKVNPLQSPVASYSRSYRDGVGGYTFDTQTSIIPTNYDDGSGTLIPLSNNNKWSIQRHYFFGQTNQASLVVGQAEYNSSDEARAAIFDEDPDISPLVKLGHFVSALLIKKNATVLNDTVQALYVPINLELTGAGSSGINSLAEDLTPQLGGTLDYNGQQGRESKGADVASASALTLGDDGNYFDITGTTTITSIVTKAIGTVVKLHFDGILILTHNATSLILPTGTSISTQVGDEVEFVEYDTGNWRCAKYTRADGTPLASVAHATSHVTGGGDKIRDASNSQDGLATAAQITAIEANTAASHGVNDPNTSHYLKSETDSLIDATLKPPEAYDPTGTGNYPTTYGGGGIQEGDSFRITANQIDIGDAGRSVNIEDLLIAITDSPSATLATDWMVAESNRDQATETVKGVAELATQAEADAGTNDTNIMTALKTATMPQVANALHDDQAGEITAITEKTGLFSPDDEGVMEDSDAADAKKSFKFGLILPYRRVTETTHGIPVLKSVRFDGSNYVLSRSDDKDTVGEYVVVGVPDVNTLYLAKEGIFTFTAHGFALGVDQYESTTSAGDPVTTEPSAPNYSTLMFKALTTNTVEITIHNRPVQSLL